MALFKRADLVKKYGVSQAYLKSYIDRKQLKLNEQNLIDDGDPVNEAFIAKMEALKAEKNNIASASQNQSMQLPVYSSPQKKGKAFDPETTEIDFHNDYVMRKLEKYFKTSKVKEERDLARLKKEKIQGSTIPVDMIKALIVIQAESSRLAWTDATYGLITLFAAELKLTREQVARIKKELIPVINQAVDQAANLAKKELRRIQLESSETKGRGEHE